MNIPNSRPTTAPTKKAARPDADCAGVAVAARVATALMLPAAPPAAKRIVFIGARTQATCAKPISTAAKAARTSVAASERPEPGHIGSAQ
jgi:hypothetical protein